MEGDTPSYLGLINNGLNASRRPDWGGWGGRYVFRTPRGETRPFWTQGGDLFTRVTSQDTVRGADGREYASDQAAIWRWREAFHDFAVRMDWSVSDFAHANHSPAASVNGDGGKAPILIDAQAGSPVILEAGETGSILARCHNRKRPLSHRSGRAGPGVAHIILAVTAAATHFVQAGNPDRSSERRALNRTRHARLPYSTRNRMPAPGASQSISRPNACSSPEYGEMRISLWPACRK